MTATALTIAGSDSGGGAGIQADIKTFSSLGVYATSAITALTAQNTVGVQGVNEIPADFVAAQINSICSDIDIKATKLGMLANAEIVTQVCKSIDEFSLQPLVLDPVMVAQSGDRLLSASAVNSIKQDLIPRATIITPNLHEAAVLLDSSMEDILSDPDDALKQLLALGPQAVLLKGGHAHDLVAGEGDAEQQEVVDYFATSSGVTLYKKQLVPTANTHGSGCTLAAAITAYLALGEDLTTAVASANKFIDGAIKAADALAIGKGSGPVHHCHNSWD